MVEQKPNQFETKEEVDDMGLLSKIRERQKAKAESDAFIKSVEDEIKEKRREGYRKQRLKQAEEEGKLLAEKTLEPQTQESTLQRIGRVARNMSSNLEKADVMGSKGQSLDPSKFSVSNLLGMNEGEKDQYVKKKKRKSKDNSRVGIEP